MSNDRKQHNNESVAQAEIASNHITKQHRLTKGL